MRSHVLQCYVNTYVYMYVTYLLAHIYSAMLIPAYRDMYVGSDVSFVCYSQYSSWQFVVCSFSQCKYTSVFSPPPLIVDILFPFLLSKVAEQVVRAKREYDELMEEKYGPDNINGAYILPRGEKRTRKIQM